ncbi:MAG: LD-carboxypeptidase [bacterium]|nr:LD-carboxypeptidase [bacterium]MDY2830332.1 LD-carboxypeptidase [Alphaproteobacteria bacterium]
MENLIPQKLCRGDEIRIVAPSTGLKIIGQDCRQIAKERFEKMGLKVSFGKNTTDDNFDLFGTVDIQKRAEDIMDAFKEPSVKAIFTIIGGFNSNQVLPFLDYGVIRQNPKILCGFSDITALINGIRAQTGLVGFYGPHYSSIGMLKGCDYTLAGLQKVLFDGQSTFEPSKDWSDDLWFLDQENRIFVPNEGWWILHEGQAKGTLEGGNLGTLVLLGGTPYQPVFGKDTILAVEDCFTSGGDDKAFLRQLQALAQRVDFVNVAAVLIGRFQKASGITRDKLEYIVSHIPQLAALPVIANMDFGHTTPLMTLPLGGMAEVSPTELKVRW